MADKPHGPTMTDVHSPDTMSPGGRAAVSDSDSAMRACGMSHKGLKGLCLMIACCAAPLLLWLALPILGVGLGGRSAPVVNTLAVLACPVGMVLMMWMMRGRRANAQPPIQAQPIEAALPCQVSRPRAGHGLLPQKPLGGPAP